MTMFFRHIFTMVFVRHVLTNNAARNKFFLHFLMNIFSDHVLACFINMFLETNFYLRVVKTCFSVHVHFYVFSLGAQCTNISKTCFKDFPFNEQNEKTFYFCSIQKSKRTQARLVNKHISKQTQDLFIGSNY